MFQYTKLNEGLMPCRRNRSLVVILNKFNAFGITVLFSTVFVKYLEDVAIFCFLTLAQN